MELHTYLMTTRRQVAGDVSVLYAASVRCLSACYLFSVERPIHAVGHSISVSVVVGHKAAGGAGSCNFLTDTYIFPTEEIRRSKF